MKKIAIIPARGGSKRIVGKNIRSFCGRPIISYSIEAALSSKIFDDVIVSTDDPEIAEVAIECGGKVPFQRSEENSGDFAPTSEVIKEVLSWYKNQGESFESFCCIYPTAPFVSSRILLSSFELFKSGGYETLLPIVPFSYPVQRALRITSDNGVEMVENEHLLTRSQDLERRYHDAGQFYWGQCKLFLKNGKLFTENSGYVVLNELEVQDIDNETDWKIAELKYQLRNAAN